MIYFLICLYAKFHGETNAFLYSKKGAEALTDNEHEWLVYERGCMFLAIACAPFYAVLAHFFFESWAHILVLYFVEIVCGVLSFSYYHNNNYYLMRDRIDNTTHGAKHQSPSTTAVMDFNYQERRKLHLFAVGFFCLALFNLLVRIIF